MDPMSTNMKRTCSTAPSGLLGGFANLNLFSPALLPGMGVRQLQLHWSSTMARAVIRILSCKLCRYAAFLPLPADCRHSAVMLRFHRSNPGSSPPPHPARHRQPPARPPLPSSAGRAPPPCLDCHCQPCGHSPQAPRGPPLLSRSSLPQNCRRRPKLRILRLAPASKEDWVNEVGMEMGMGMRCAV